MKCYAKCFVMKSRLPVRKLVRGLACSTLRTAPSKRPQATVKGLTPRDLIDPIDARIILSNTYHLFLRPGHELIRETRGLHKFMAWPRAIPNVSSDYHFCRFNELRKMTNKGVMRHSHLDGSRRMFATKSMLALLAHTW